MSTFFTPHAKDAIPVTPLTGEELESWLQTQDAHVQNFVKAQDFTAAPHSKILIPDAQGTTERVLVGVDESDLLYRFAGIGKSLPTGTYTIDANMNEHEATQAAIGWALGQYEFDKYLDKKSKTPNLLVTPKNAQMTEVESTINAMTMVRDLVNIPANDMGPSALQKAAEKLAKDFNGKSTTIIGDDLLKENYPLVHAVGRASDDPPRLVDITWGDENAPKVTLVGKGVTFDTGGLNIKPGAPMSLMKKDMGGAAHVLGLARMIMENNLPVRLRVLVPIAENSISGNAFRPSDVIPSRKGISVEIENTDAEGRLILADALTEACTENPDLLIDFATLTGAARVALGPDVPPFFTDDETLAKEFLAAGEKQQDPVWQLPLWKEYRDMLSSTVADICHTGAGGQAGAITAALFLQSFVDDTITWAHIDTWAWRKSNRPGRPQGGDAIGMRAAYDVIKSRYKPKP